MRERRFVRLGLLGLFGLVVCLAAAGCSARYSWVYAPKLAPMTSSPRDRSVAVTEFKDTRPSLNYNRWAMYLVPLVPFGWQNLGKPEGCSMHFATGPWVFRPSADLARALASELSNTRLYRDVYFTERPNPGDLVLEGNLRSTGYRSRTFSYGLSLNGPLLWYVGAPAGWVRNELELELQLTDPGAQRTLWKWSGKRELSKVLWLYYMPTDFRYQLLFEELAREALADLDKALRAEPPAPAAAGAGAPASR